MPAPFVNQKFTFTNPDGTTIQVVGTGNQYHARFETEDGFSVVKNPQTGYYSYAQLSADQTTLLPTTQRVNEVDPSSLGLEKHVRIRKQSAKVMAENATMAQGPSPRWKMRRALKKAANAQQRRAAGLESAPMSAPTVGNYVGLCILIEFPDVPHTISAQEVEDFCNQTGYTGSGNNGSVKDYFLDNSQGKLTYTNIVTPYYMAAHNRDYYTDPSVSFGSRARELITEALDHFKAQGFNFTPFTADSGGFIYALNVFYAGARVNNWSEGLWPHQWVLSVPYDVGSGRKFNDYQITNMGSELTLRTFCHENGHMICDFPDLYDYGGDSSGVGDFCLMCFGGADKNPVQVGAYLKNEAGWATSLTTITAGITASLNAANNDFYIHEKNADEYFIIENRQKIGRDIDLPDAGLAIWHIDEQGSNQNQQMTAGQHYECSIEQADNKFDLEFQVNGGDDDDLFSAPNNTEFSDATAPDSKWWDGSNSDLKIANISNSGPIMTFQALGNAGWVFGKNVRYTNGGTGTKWAHAIIEGFDGWRRIAPTSVDGVTNVLTILNAAVANNKQVNVYFGADGMIYGTYMS